jgi:hypothetical protein
MEDGQANRPVDRQMDKRRKEGVLTILYALSYTYTVLQAQNHEDMLTQNWDDEGKFWKNVNPTVLLTLAEKLMLSIISRIFEDIPMLHLSLSGARAKLIFNVKKPKSKISRHCPFLKRVEDWEKVVFSTG